MAANKALHGAEVYGIDGKKIGTVKTLRSGAPGAASGSSSGEPIREETSSPDENLQDHELVNMKAAGGAVNAGVPIRPADGSSEEATPPTHSGLELSASDTKYLEVHHGGMLHLGGSSLFVPFSAVNVVEADGSIVLRCTADEAAEQYSREPMPLEST